MIDVTVPSVGESVSSGILAVWLKKDGQFVNSGDELFELETDKATMAIPAPASGKLTISVKEGTEIQIGAIVAKIDETAKADASAPAVADSPSGGAAGAAATAVASAAPAAAAKLDDLAPAVRKLVVEKGLDPATIRGTGPGGRILKEDVLAHLEGTGSAGGQAATGAAPVAPQPTQSAAAPAGLALGAGSPIPGSRDQRRIPMTPIRKKIAERLVYSKQSAAHLTTFNEVDMSAVMALRSQYKDVFEKKYGVKLGFMSFFIKAAANALLRYPEVNAFIDGDDILYNDYVDVAVAMSTDRGLITPVIRSVEGLNFAQIEAAILDYGQKAKNKRILPGDLAGGTFTVSNGGVFGSMLSTPIPNPPQTAVLGMHTIQERPVVRDGQIVIRPMMYLALSYDHRLIDGKEAISFLLAIKEQVEDPARMALQV